MSRRKLLFHIGRISVLLGLIIIVAACQGTASQPATPTPLPETPMSIPTPESIATFTSEATAETPEIPPTEYPPQLDATKLASPENELDLPIVAGPEPGSLREATTGPPAGSDAASGDTMSSGELDPLSIESLRQHHDEPPPTIEIVAPLMETEYFTRHQVVYTSDGLRITGVMNVPKRDTPSQGFPVILLNHGHYSPSDYTPGTGTQREADYLAEHGYVTIASDYRGYAGSEGDLGGHFDPGWTYDILDLLDALPSLNVVDPERVGMWGHSTGGEIALRVIVARDTVDATVLFGSMGADAADNFRLVQGWGGGHAVVQRYGTPEEAPEVWAKLSPMTYLADASGPISIHHGELDGEVPPELSARLSEAMQAAGVPGEHHTYPDQHHVFRGEAWALAMERTLAFLDRYVKNQ
jgi:dienelactone hydrolase